MAIVRKGKIEKWLDALDPDDAAEFRSFAESNAHRPAHVHSWLMQRDMVVALNTVTTWLRENCPAGRFAEQFNTDAENFQGVDVRKAYDRATIISARLYQLLYEKVEDAAQRELTLKDALFTLPSILREHRMLLTEGAQHTVRVDIETIIQSGVSRLVEIIQNNDMIKHSPDGPFILEIVTAAALQVVEESRNQRHLTS